MGQSFAGPSRGYMLGYSDLKDPSVSRFFRFLARVGDGMMKMQIQRIVQVLQDLTILKIHNLEAKRIHPKMRMGYTQF